MIETKKDKTNQYSLLLKVLILSLLLLVFIGWSPAWCQAVQYGNDEASDYGSTYKSSDYTYLMWDRNDEGDGHFVNNSTPKFFYWDNDVGQLNYLLDTGSMSQLEARFHSSMVGKSNLSGVMLGEGYFQSQSPLANTGFVTAPWVYARAIEGDGRGSGATLITIGGENGFTNRDEVGFITNGNMRMIVKPNGKVGIGTTNPSSRLTVNGTTKTKEVIVEENVGADFVFEEDYPLADLSELASFIRSNKHLPEIPSAEQMKRDGVKLGALQMKLLQKIEELTLYIIQLKQESNEQELRFKKRINDLIKEIDQLKHSKTSRTANDEKL